MFRLAAHRPFPTREARDGLRAGGFRLRALGLPLALLALGACAEEPTDETPDGAVRLFIDAMARSQTQQGAVREAFRLLDRAARRELGRRAERASTLSGRRLHPWDMIPQGRFRLRFRPRRENAYSAHVDGDRGTVTVLGQGEGQAAEVPVVREDGHWRVVLPVPGAVRRDRADGPPTGDGTPPSDARDGLPDTP